MGAAAAPANAATATPLCCGPAVAALPPCFTSRPSSEGRAPLRSGGRGDVEKGGRESAACCEAPHAGWKPGAPEAAPAASSAAALARPSSWPGETALCEGGPTCPDAQGVCGAMAANSIAMLRFRRVLKWSGFFTPVIAEVAFHFHHGLSRATFDLEETCEASDSDCSPLWASFLVFAELICRVSLAVVLADAVWQLCRAALHPGGIGIWLRHSLELDGHPWSRHRVYIPASALSILTFVVGMWGTVVGDGGLPLWAAVYSHVAEVFCHAVVFSAFGGGCGDLLAAASGGKLKALFGRCLRCFDTIEAHGVGRDHEGHAGEMVFLSFEHRDSLQHARHELCRPCARRARLIFVWSAFLATLAGYVASAYFPDASPAWVGMLIDFLGRFCWSGLAWLMVLYVARGEMLLSQHVRANGGLLCTSPSCPDGPPPRPADASTASPRPSCCLAPLAEPPARRSVPAAPSPTCAEPSCRL